MSHEVHTRELPCDRKRSTHLCSETSLAGHQSETPPRFVPTCVGTTIFCGSRGVTAAVHPHIQNGGPFVDVAGSSPRLWGPRGQRLQGQGRDWFIPTPVGTTSLEAISLANQAVHPHACGDHVLVAVPMYSRPGSSPRLWGPQTPLRDGLPDQRFIPTPVGTSAVNRDLGHYMPVHPHVRGNL